MDNILDAVISINTNKMNERKVITSFVYNRYKSNETIIDDTLIKNNDKLGNNEIKSRFIRLSVARVPGLYDQDLDEYTLDIPELYNISEIDSLGNNELIILISRKIIIILENIILPMRMQKV